MKLLILSGTKFLGRHLVTAALTPHHQMTLFNRCRHSTEKIENVELLHGDRNQNLDRLKNRKWDAVIILAATCRRRSRLLPGH